MSTPPKPTDGELEILHILWQEGVATVRQVNDALAQQRPVGYTTTLKLMQIMHDKGLLAREKQGKTHLYRPLISELETRRHLLDKLLSTAFRGSAAELVMQALGRHRASQAELDEIRQLLDELDDASNTNDPKDPPA